MNSFIEGFVKGVRETPRGYFAPLIFVWRWMAAVVESAPTEKKAAQR